MTKFNTCDIAAVGCMVDSDGTCAECKASFEQFCLNCVLTYNFPNKHTGGVTTAVTPRASSSTSGSSSRVAANLDLAGTAPLLCAGITTYSPLRHWGVTKGTSAAPVTSLPTLKSFPSKSERGLRSAS